MNSRRFEALACCLGCGSLQSSVCQVWCFSVLSYRWSSLCSELGLSWGRTPGTWLLCEKEMEEICSSLFGPGAISAHKVRSAFMNGPTERSAVLTVAALLARNVYHIGGTVAVPQKCRITQPGKLICVCVCVLTLTRTTNKHTRLSYFPSFMHKRQKKLISFLLISRIDWLYVDKLIAYWTYCLLVLLIAQEKSRSSCLCIRISPGW